MSADRYSICPKCNYRNPDRQDDEDEFQGSLRFDLDVDATKVWFSLRITCGECGFQNVFSHHDFRL